MKISDNNPRGMNIAEAKQFLKKYGRLQYRGVQFFETIKIVGNSHQQTGKYIVKADGEIITPAAVSLSRAFVVGKKFFL